ncbi:hypothetical protein H2509_10465 [Stappia sp. F7233]|uniref:Uncharacterized protein n=1 Tax=Stappia albiluteola TaxID=2758565 RepID=A0A839AEI4_9HYPH|nr:hypothetical protein [Stappia albiluteola]MBA5777545.1 hypothetical protein [Stappia albiluteola]
MRSRTMISLALALMVFPLIAGAGITTILVTPALYARAEFLFPAVGIVALILTPIVSWKLAPRMRLRFWRKQ